MPTITEKPAIPLPFYLRASQIVIGLVAFFYVLYIGQDIIVPLIYATVLAILLNPFVNLLHRKGINRILSIAIALLIAIILLAGLIYFIMSQASMFSDTLPQLKTKMTTMLQDSVNWVSSTFNVSTKKVDEWIAKTRTQGLNNSSAMIGQTLNTISGVLIMVFLLPVYIFMILFYKPLLLEFIGMLFPKSKHATVAEVLMETKSLIQNYLIGLLFEAGIVAFLNSVGLLALGIDYAILLGILGALLNIIPYIGGVVAVALPMILALATKEPVYALYVLILYIIVQFIDNNFIVPKVVASKVKINALISIIVVLIGGALWGVSGMFLSIPLTAILKVIFDRIEGLKAWGFLLGDTMPQMIRFKFVKAKAKQLPPADKSPES